MEEQDGACFSGHEIMAMGGCDRAISEPKKGVERGVRAAATVGVGVGQHDVGV